ncbi:methionine adenosyltransferase [candidate division KSB1 bacterium]|nr:methionine adenosyltransferase [candidate division KSB1 bacterium]
MSSYVFSSESVSEGHPDKIADQISDAVLDAVFTDDINGRVACETFVTTGLALVGGEITTTTYVDIPKIVRGVIKDIGYNDSRLGFDYETCAVLTSIDRQSTDIDMGVKTGGAGDQGIMFGYATKETPELMPLPISLAHKLVKKLSEMRKNGSIPFLRPDGKSQVSIRYENGKPVSADTVVISTQHNEDVSIETLRSEIIEKVIKPVLPENLLNDNTIFHINPTGRFVIGGPMGDTGLTGRKIIVDTYGGIGSHGGGAFSGKDPSKVDRSASYAVRWIAKNIVAAGLAEKCEIQLAYAIGVAEPVSIMVDASGTGSMENGELEILIRKKFDLTPNGIIKSLDLRRPIYRKTAVYGHFGREDEDFTWEKTDRVDDLHS